MKFIKKLFITLLLIITLFIGVIAFMGYSMYQNAVNNKSISSKITEIKSNENYTTFDKIPDDFKHAIVAVEDHRFYDHSGIDIITTTRSLLENLKEKEIVAGGSTISQQTGRLLYFTQEKHFYRKVAELFVAFDLERMFSKDDILELYCNMIYYGNGYYGIYEASKGYFDKEPQDLSLDECSLLAGLPNAPSAYSPTKNPNLAKKRQSVVLRQMVKYNYISEEQKQAIESNDINIID